ncbi:PilW family protein [Reinekea sp.]|jgi:type IV pilus assembly protein PilW|uniref:PilW family protein n=1 Tax=Reinekea sp. TaxID=1970455 RepID=UPI00398936BD
MKNLKQAGLTLVELLIAVALSAVIIIGIVQVFLSNREAFNLSESMARVQENGRFAVNVISESIRSSGNYGCIPWYSPDIGNIQRQVTNTEINGFDAVTPATIEGAGVVNGVPGPDQLELLRVVGDPVSISSIDYAANQITTDWAADVAENDLVLVSNCLVGDYIKAGATTAGQIIEDDTKSLRTGLYDRLDQQNTVTRVERIRFEIDGDNNLALVTNDGDAGINGSTVPLIGGVENIQFRYGVDLDDNFVPDYIADYGDIPAADWPNIIAVEVNVLVGSLDSVENVVSEPQTINFAGGVFVAPDRRLYRAFQTLVTIRNRVK